MSLSSNYTHQTSKNHSPFPVSTGIRKLLPAGVSQKIKKYIVPTTAGILGGSVLTLTDPRGLAIASVAKKCFSEVCSQIEQRLFKGKSEQIQLSSDKDRVQAAVLSYGAKFIVSCWVGRVASKLAGYETPFSSIIGGQLIEVATDLFFSITSINDDPFCDSDIPSLTSEKYQK